jgi:hypothetical protein
MKQIKKYLLSKCKEEKQRANLTALFDNAGCVPLGNFSQNHKLNICNYLFRLIGK